MQKDFAFSSCIQKGELLTKTSKVMRLTAFFLLACCLSVTANGVSQTVTYIAKDAKLADVLSAIEKQTDYSFYYKVEVLEKARPVSVELKDATIDNALSAVFNNQPLSYKMIDKNIVVTEKNKTVYFIDPNAPVPPIKISGTIISANKDPLGGATIRVRGKNTITTSDDKGYFEIMAEPGSVLIISYVGFQVREFRVSSSQPVVIEIIASNNSLDTTEVVINTGYQKIRPERFVGSYSQLDSANFHRRAGMGILERLNGTVPGMLFNTKGGNNFPIIIRGLSTLGLENTNTSPLIVVDNFPTDERFSLNSLNPNDVESITILKDAAAASIWGTRAGNGVIVITTKKGRFNQRFNLNLTSNTTLEEKPDLFYIPRINTSDFIDIESMLFGKGFYDARLNTKWQPVSPIIDILDNQKRGVISAIDAQKEIDNLRQFDIRNDLDKFVYREAIRQQHHIDASGGNNTHAYRFSLGYNRTLNNLKEGRPDQQITFSSYNTLSATKKLLFQIGVNFTYDIGRGNNGISVPSDVAPYERLASNDGVPLPITRGYRLGYVDTVGKDILLDWHYQPLEDAKLADNRRTSRLMLLNFGTTYRIASALNAQFQYQFMNNLTTVKNYYSLQTYVTRDLINIYTNPFVSDNTRFPIPRGGILDLINTQSQNHNIRGSLNFNETFNIDHTINLLVGGELSEGKGSSSSVRFYGYNEDLATYNNVIDYATQFPKFYASNPGEVSFIPPTNYSYSEALTTRIISVLANANYSYRNRYNLYASARRDGANVFGVNTNNRWKPLWSVGGSWNISKENFYSISWLPMLRLKMSYGYTGNVNNRLSGLLTMSYNETPETFTQLIYANANRAPNPDLKWETVKISNIGLDVQLLDNRFSGSFEMFQKDGSDIISELIYPTSSGVNTFTVNAASVRTRGFDFNIQTTNLNKAITWKTGFNLSYAKTVVTKFYRALKYPRAEDFINYAINPIEGEIAYGISSYRWAGLNPTTGDPQGYLNGIVSQGYNAIFRDTISNQVFHGSSLPLFTGFLRNDFVWKGFSISFNLIGRFKYFYRKPTLNLEYAASYGQNNYIGDYHNRWQKLGDETKTSIPSMRYPNPTGELANRSAFYQNAEINVFRGDNIRLQDVRLSYFWTNKKGTQSVKNAHFFLYPNNLNLILWRMEDDHYDPDVYGGSGFPVSPITRTWTVGVMLGF